MLHFRRPTSLILKSGSPQADNQKGVESHRRLPVCRLGTSFIPLHPRSSPNRGLDHTDTTTPTGVQGSLLRAGDDRARPGNTSSSRGLRDSTFRGILKERGLSRQQGVGKRVCESKVGEAEGEGMEGQSSDGQAGWESRAGGQGKRGENRMGSGAG